ncbi:hypothetical protein F9C11_29825 [Amycolatopsis sp. VS8301801F10]|uniref:hypothetical protein n=1 Tax=Amycolatopsis sp. VS8301801F10 TaxID=2652442 RepID=UPI0038FD2122
MDAPTKVWRRPSEAGPMGIERTLLVKLVANTGDPVMAEFARELLAGNVTPRRVVESQLYASALEVPASGLTAWYSGLS